jgi:hypothetical protein
VQYLFTRVGVRLSVDQIRTLNACVSYLEVGRWMRERKFEDRPRYESRDALYTAIAHHIANERVLYLEFGVWQGRSMRVWSGLLKNPLALLHGFDSFEGLPEDWDASRPKGTFSVNSVMPTFADSRVILHKGWFDQTLSTFTLPEHERLVVNLDADLYSSTVLVLSALEHAMKPGTILIFDEFCDRLHELKAFSEFLDRTRMQFRFAGATENLEQVAFERTV